MKVGLLGAGTIGFGVWELAKSIPDIEITKVLDRREIEGLENVLTKNADDMLSDPEIDTVVELLGGDEPAYTWAMRAIESGKSFVSANKLMLSHHLAEIMSAAKAKNLNVRVNASVGGSIPYLINILRARRLGGVSEVYGILNGTTNYILTLMGDEGISFENALKLAQDAGYAEANPASDISGDDARSKITIASSLAFDGFTDRDAVLCEGIESISADDIKAVKSRGKAIKLIARAKKSENGVCCYVEPTLFDEKSVMGNVSGVENAACLIDANAGLHRFTGAGAGRYPTAYAVIEDLIDISRNSDAYRFEVSGGKIDVDNGAEKHEYIARGLTIEGATDIGGGYIITPEMSVSDMHNAAADARANGKNVFFAGII